MSDIFLSYSSSEKERVDPIVQQFEQQGWTVWWDRKIPPGKTFDEVIEEALNAAKCVVVVWSAESVKSNWVKTEANEGVRRGILIPILIDDVTIPLEFRRIEAAKLTDLTNLSSNPELRGLLNSISTLIGKPLSEELKRPESQIEIEERLKQEEERKADAERKIQEEERKQKEEEAKRRASEEEKKKREEEAKRKAIEEERQQQEQIDALYEQAQEQARLHQWEQAQEKMKEIQALEPQFADPQGISTKAQEELKRKTELLEQERHKQEAQARPPRTEVEQEKDEEIAKVALEEKIQRPASKPRPQPEEYSIKGRVDKRKTRRAFLWVYWSVGGLILLVLIIGGLQVRKSLQLRKQAYTMKDIVRISTAIVDYIVDNGKAPKQDGTYNEYNSEFYEALCPFYLKILPIKDKWGNHYRVYCGKACDGMYGISNSEKDDFMVVSFGKDGYENYWRFNPKYPESGLYDKNIDNLVYDLIMWNGIWIRAPITNVASTSQRP